MDLPGHGASPVPPETVGLADYVQAVAERLRSGPPAHLVAHSMGGMVAAHLAETCADHLLSVTYVAAFIPRNGQSLLDLVRSQDAPGIEPALIPGPVPGTTLLDTEIAAPILMQDASPKDQAAALRAISAQPNRAQTDPARLTGRAAVPTAYIHCTQDRTVTLPLQRKMVQTSPCDYSYTLTCGHVPQLTRPRELAGCLLDLALTIKAQS